MSSCQVKEGEKLHTHKWVCMFSRIRAKPFDILNLQGGWLTCCNLVFEHYNLKVLVPGKQRHWKLKNPDLSGFIVFKTATAIFPGMRNQRL